MERISLKKVTQINSNLDLPLISFSYEEDRNTIHLRVVDPSSYKRKEGNVTGFQIIYNPNYTVENVDKDEFDKWVKKFKRSIGPALREVFEYEMNLRVWFPYMKSYEVRVEPHAVDTYSGEDLFVPVYFTVRFSKEVPYDEFIGNFFDFINVLFDENGYIDLVDETVEALISEEFPEASISTQIALSSKYKLLMGRTKSFINPEFIDISIKLVSPLHESVLNSLLNSSNEGEFVFKFSVYIDPDKVGDIYMRRLGREESGRWVRDINEIKRLLSEVVSLTLP